MAYRLRIVSGPGTGTDKALDAEDLTIGRSPENWIVINDSNVSRVHARFTLDPGGRVVVADNGSRNGVYVNDRKVAQQPLNAGDRVVIGQSVMELVSDGARKPAPLAPAGKPGQLRTGPRPPAPRSGAVARNAPRRAKQGGMGMAALFAVVVVGALFVAFAVSNLGGNKGSSPGGLSPVVAGTHSRPTPPPFLSSNTGPITPGQSASVQKCNKAAKEWLDVGDSNMVSQNLTKACDAFKQAKKADRYCASADARLQVAQDKVRGKVLDYERAGQLQYDSGDYLGAIERWKIAKEFILGCIGDPNDPRIGQLNTQIDQAGKLVRKQPQ